MWLDYVASCKDNTTHNQQQGYSKQGQGPKLHKQEQDYIFEKALCQYFVFDLGSYLGIATYCLGTADLKLGFAVDKVQYEIVASLSSQTYYQKSEVDF